MIAVDTNILARFYVDDPADPEAARQRLAAKRVMSRQAVYVPLTVMLELEWVTRAFYGFDATAFSCMAHHLLGLPNVTVEDWTRVADALDLHEQGVDFADALHLAASRHCVEFATFDRRFARKAAKLSVSPPVAAPS